MSLSSRIYMDHSFSGSVSGSCSLLRIERFSVASFFNFNYQFKSDVVEAVDVSTAASTK